LPREEHRDGYQITRLTSLRTQPYRASFPAMAAYVLAGLWAGYRLIRLFQPDVIHAHFAVPGGTLAWILSRLTGIPYVLTAHLGDVPGGVVEKTDRWFRWVYPFTHAIWREASRIVAVSEFTRELALKKYQAEIRVIPNGVDVDSMKPRCLHLNAPARIVFAGRFMPQKNPLQVVRSLNELRELGWECVMIGDGPLLDEVKRLVVELELQERFQFPGWLGRAEVLDWFNRSDILFMPPLSEGLPVVGVEALSKGLAIVASRVGGFVDLVSDNRNGYLLDPEDSTGFSTSLRRLLSDAGCLSSFRAASLDMARRFDIHHIVEQYETVFLSVLKK
jgi:glycosyltransferase involved in cell wall biosynthesis